MLAFQRAPPGFVGAVPRDGTGMPSSKRICGFQPRACSRELSSGVPAVVPEPVGDVFDVTLDRTPARADQHPRELEIGQRGSTAAL